MSQIVLDAETLAKLDNMAARLGSTREDTLNQAIDKFAAYLAEKADYDNWLAKKVAKSIKAVEESRLLSASDIDVWSETMIANFDPRKKK